MTEPIIVVNTENGKKKLHYNKKIVVGNDSEKYSVIIPIICNSCEKRIYYEDELEQFDSHERQMGMEIYLNNSESDFYCHRCDAAIHVLVEIHEYAGEFDFYNSQNQNCDFSHVFDLQELSFD